MIFANSCYQLNFFAPFPDFCIILPLGELQGKKLVPGAGALALFPVKCPNKIKGHRHVSLVQFLPPPSSPLARLEGRHGGSRKGCGRVMYSKNCKLIKANSINSMLLLMASLHLRLISQSLSWPTTLTHHPKTFPKTLKCF